MIAILMLTNPYKNKCSFCVCLLLIGERNHLAVGKLAAIYGESYERSLLVPALNAGSTGVDVEQVQRLVELHCGDMRVPTDEKLGRRGIDCAHDRAVVVARIAANVL